MRRFLSPVGKWDHVLGALIALVYLVVLVKTAPDLAMARDESFYVDAADRYGEWIKLAWEDPSSALTVEAIDHGWNYNHEHPGFMKSLFALSSLAHKKWDLFAHDSTSYRFPAMVTSALLLWLTYIFGARVYGRKAGLFASLAMATMPQVFYNAHLDCFDVPIVFFLTLTTYAYWRSLESKTWALFTGLAYGLSLGTKHNAWILPGVLVVHFAWMAAGELARRRRGLEKRVSLVPWWLVSMIVFGPIIFYGTWPWIWHTTLDRFREYAAFHLHHEYYNMEYFGRNWFKPPFPVHYPFVMTAISVPAVTLLFAAAALLRRAPSLLPRVLRQRLGAAALAPDARFTFVLMIGAIAAPILVIALPWTPIFGGTKHWFPSYPFLAIEAGAGFAWATRRAFAWLPQVRQRAFAAIFAFGIAATPCVAETAHSHPFGLSHYTFFGGGVPGGADLGMNRQFWGYTTGSVVPWLIEHLPNGGSVWINDTTHGAWQMLKRDGLLPESIHVAPSMQQADYVLVHHEKHFDEVDYQAWVAFGSVAPAYVLTQDGVPIVTIYKNNAR